MAWAASGPMYPLSARIHRIRGPTGASRQLGAYTPYVVSGETVAATCCSNAAARWPQRAAAMARPATPRRAAAGPASPPAAGLRRRRLAPQLWALGESAPGGHARATRIVARAVVGRSAPPIPPPSPDSPPLLGPGASPLRGPLVHRVPDRCGGQRVPRAPSCCRACCGPAPDTWAGSRPGPTPGPAAGPGRHLGRQQARQRVCRPLACAGRWLDPA
jgi:hypothetical protein